METVFSCFSFLGVVNGATVPSRFRPVLARAPFIHPRARRSSFSYTWYTLYQRISAVPVAHCCRGRPGWATDGESLNRNSPLDDEMLMLRGTSAQHSVSQSVSQRACGGQPIVLASTRRSGGTRPEVSVPKRLPTGAAAHGPTTGRSPPRRR